MKNKLKEEIEKMSFYIPQKPIAKWYKLDEKEVDKLLSLFLSYLRSMEEMGQEEDWFDEDLKRGYEWQAANIRNKLRKSILNRVKAELKEVKE